MLQKQGFFSTIFLYRTQVNIHRGVDIPYLLVTHIHDLDHTSLVTHFRLIS